MKHPVSLTLLLILAITAMSRGALCADTPPLPVDAYWRGIEETQDQLASLADAEAVHPDDLLITIAWWASFDQVLLSDGTAIPVDHSFILAMMREDPVDVQHLEQLLTTLRFADRSQVPAAFHPEHQQALTNILAQPDFQWAEKEPTALEIWWEKFWDRIEKLFDRFLPDDQPSEVTVTLPNPLTFVGVIGLALVIFYTVRQLGIEFVPETAVDPDGSSGDEDLTSSVALKRAQSLSAGGDYRSAVRYLYLSALLMLDERGLLRYDRSLTNREYERNLRDTPDLSKTFGEVVNVFDQVWYGNHPLDADAYADYAEAVEDLEQQK